LVHSTVSDWELVSSPKPCHNSAVA
jgi:hypothetical protein